MTDEKTLEEFHDRLQHAVGDMSYRKLGRLTDTHPETVRRYMQGQAPSTTFLINFCRAFGISADWLLTGRGAMRCSDIRMNALRLANPSELLGALAVSLANQTERLTRIEQLATPSDAKSDRNSMHEHKLDTRPKAMKLSMDNSDTHEDHACCVSEATKPTPHQVAESTDESKSVTRIREALSRRTA
jgi:transcriptional regulator with XRE-family HTH domain